MVVVVEGDETDVVVGTVDAGGANPGPARSSVGSDQISSATERATVSTMPTIE